VHYDRFTPTDISCPDLLVGHELRVVGVGIDQYAIRLKYRITPPLPNSRPSDPPTPGWTPPVSWAWHARDDLGNRYAQAGGAYGLSHDEQSIEGVFSLVPLPPRDARSLRVSLGAETRSGVEVTSTFEVPLPLSPTNSGLPGS